MFEILSICKGGGYRYCRTNPSHPNRNSSGLYPLHRVLMENKIGRLLKRSEHVHHKDENKSNDDPDNLELKTGSEHSKLHWKKRAPLQIKCICTCGKIFYLKPHAYRLRIGRNKTKKVFCCRSCGGKK